MPAAAGRPCARAGRVVGQRGKSPPRLLAECCAAPLAVAGETPRTGVGAADSTAIRSPIVLAASTSLRSEQPPIPKRACASRARRVAGRARRLLEITRPASAAARFLLALFAPAPGARALTVAVAPTVPARLGRRSRPGSARRAFSVGMTDLRTGCLRRLVAMPGRVRHVTVAARRHTLAGPRTPLPCRRRGAPAAQLADYAVGRASRETWPPGASVAAALVLIAAPPDTGTGPEIAAPARPSSCTWRPRADDVWSRSAAAGQAPVARHGEACARDRGPPVALAFAVSARGSHTGRALPRRARRARGDALQSERRAGPRSPSAPTSSAAGSRLAALWRRLRPGRAIRRPDRRDRSARRFGEPPPQSASHPAAATCSTAMDPGDAVARRRPAYGPVTLPLRLAAQRDEHVAAACSTASGAGNLWGIARVPHGAMRIPAAPCGACGRRPRGARRVPTAAPASAAAVRPTPATIEIDASTLTALLRPRSREGCRGNDSTSTTRRAARERRPLGRRSRGSRRLR